MNLMQQILNANNEFKQKQQKELDEQKAKTEAFNKLTAENAKIKSNDYISKIKIHLIDCGRKNIPIIEFHINISAELEYRIVIEEILKYLRDNEVSVLHLCRTVEDQYSTYDRYYTEYYLEVKLPFPSVGVVPKVIKL